MRGRGAHGCDGCDGCEEYLNPKDSQRFGNTDPSEAFKGKRQLDQMLPNTVQKSTVNQLF